MRVFLFPVNLIFLPFYLRVSVIFGVLTLFLARYSSLNWKSVNLGFPVRGVEFFSGSI